MSWFSSWGTASWQEDQDAAAAQAREWTATAAKARGWVDYWPATMNTFIDHAYAQASTAKAFWLKLVSEVDAHLDALGEANVPAGWVKLRNAFASAAGAAERVEEGREAGSVSTVVGGTVAGAVDDVKTAVDPRKSVLPWLVGLAGVAFLLGRK